ncbi:hemagglutinin [Chitinimonas arctica]|uniref:Neutral metalloproteinase n=1 Tax=Chitinimonas arctica TaxID=2594795 RepID=A0A516SAL3_9NEIS|nr:M4 family metallopeptidase [Chitinimonas arctica]QDQ25195.1 hemagglutinin [Chitinimonas arctica]
MKTEKCHQQRPLMLALLLAGLVPSHAAERIPLAGKVPNQAAAHSGKQLDVDAGGPATALSQRLGLATADLQAVRRLELPNGNVTVRHQQLHRGVPIWGESIVEQRGTMQALSGAMITGIEADLPSVTPALPADWALAQAKLKTGWTGPLRNAQTQLYIKLDASNRARLVYQVSFLIEGARQPSRPFFLIDANSGEVLSHWEGLTHRDATGPGGNGKTGRYEYGTNYGPLQVSDNCTMNFGGISTIDLQNGTSGGTPYQFACPRSEGSETNGAYSVVNDAHFFGTAIINMYRSWLNVAPLAQPLVMRVHYSNNFAGAFWDGTAMSFGDGSANSGYYPFVVLDIAAHEISHGFTEQVSGLKYQGQPGAINESFSDIAGEAAEYFVRGHNDFLVGAEAMRGEGAVRYMNNPPQDGQSIDHISRYTENMDVHYSSGIFNKAFYLLATKPGWNTRKAFEVMADANRLYWSQNTNFAEGSCHVLRAAQARGYNQQDVYTAFHAVGLTPCVVVDDFLIKGVPRRNLQGAANSEWHNFLTVPAGARNLTFKLSGGTGDADLYIKFGSRPTTSSWDFRPYRSGNNETVTIPVAKTGTYFVMLRGYSAYSGVTLLPDYNN